MDLREQLENADSLRLDESMGYVQRYLANAPTPEKILSDRFDLIQSNAIAMQEKSLAINQLEQFLICNCGKSGIMEVIRLLKQSLDPEKDFGIVKRDLGRLASLAGGCDVRQQQVLLDFSFDALASDLGNEWVHALLTCIVQEVVLRGNDLKISSLQNKIWKEFAGELSWLPLRRSRFESGLEFPKNVGRDPSVPFSEFLYHRSNFNHDCEVVELQDLKQPQMNVEFECFVEPGKLCQTAFEKWAVSAALQTTGKIETDNEQWSDANRNLAALMFVELMKKSTKADVGTRVSLRPIGFDVVMNCLHCASAYTGGSWLIPPENRYGAQGRRLAWMSAAGFLGFESLPAFDQLEAVAQDGIWFTFYSDAEFSENSKFGMGSIYRGTMRCLLALDDYN